MSVTLHEVAARADVSIATASRALNGLPVSKANLSKVRQAALELGYVANEAARALRSERTMTMGLIFSDLRNTLGIELLDALSERIEAAGYSLVISTARGDGERYDTLMRRFLERRVDALFCVRPKGPGDSLARYAAAGIPVAALFEAEGPFAGLPTLAPTFSRAVGDLADALAARGHRRVALLRAPERSPPLAAVGEGLEARGFEVAAVEPSEAEGMADVVAALSRRADPPTAVVAPDPQVRGLVAACAAAGLGVPANLSLISINDIGSDAWHRRHGVSAMTIDPQNMAAAAGEAMLAWIGGTPPPGRLRVQAAAFHPRASLGAAR